MNCWQSQQFKVKLSIHFQLPVLCWEWWKQSTYLTETSQINLQYHPYGKMVRNYVRKTPAYDQESMKHAIEACESGQMGYKKAAKIFNVKRETLRDQVRKRYKTMGSGRNALLSPSQETELEECLKILARWGFGFTRQETRELIGEFVVTMGIKESGYIPGEDWLAGFLQRHPRLTDRNPEQLKTSRAKCMSNQDIITHWFQLLYSELKESNLLKRPDLIYNVDESGFPLDPTRIRVLCEKNISHLFRIIGGSGRDSITVNGCASADGKVLPPYVVYSGKNLYEAWTRNGPEGSRYNVSDKGWMDSVCFLDWFENHFLKFIPAERPVMLIFDGHASHMNLKLLRKARENDIILMKLPSNSTNILQPLDVAVYGPVKTAWERILIKFAKTNLGAVLNKELFPMLLKDLWDSDAFKDSNVQAGFRRCGIYPFNPSALPSSVYDAASVFDKVDPSQWVSANDGGNPSTSSTHSSPSTSHQPSPDPGPSSPPLPAASPSTPGPSSPPLPAASPSPSTPLPLSPKKSVNNTVSIKDFFMKRISPMMAKKESGTRKRIKRAYGESLTADECISRLEEEEEAKKQPKRKCAGKGKGKGKKTPVASTSTAVNDENAVDDDIELDIPDNSDTDYDDSGDDTDWVPPRRVNRNVFDLDLFG